MNQFLQAVQLYDNMRSVQIVLFVLGCWGIVITGSLKHFGKKGDAAPATGHSDPAAGAKPAH